MPSPKSGAAGQLVGPADPKAAQNADVADPGEVEKAKAAQQQSGTGKYGKTPVKPHKPGGGGDASSEGGAAAAKSKKKPLSWIEIVMVDEDGNPVAGAGYQITLPDGSVDSGTLDEKGFVRLDGIDPGTCQVTFPDLDPNAWKRS
jgi:type VI secretion system secreted protein VgrG